MNNFELGSSYHANNELSRHNQRKSLSYGENLKLSYNKIPFYSGNDSLSPAARTKAWKI